MDPYVRIVKDIRSRVVARKLNWVLNFLSWMAKRKLLEQSWCNDYFVGFVNAGNISIDDMEMPNVSLKYRIKLLNWLSSWI